MNRLNTSDSPYLKQHAHNPVDWYPWGPEALEKAKTENKIILVSIGYSACHWCHVMAHECFENEHLAAIMNTHFVNIKVDREERPDVDAVYMDALQHMGLRGGWPLNVFLMPDAKPFYGGTYFPPEHWQQILLGIQQAFENERDKLQNSAESFTKSLQAIEAEKNSIFDIKANTATAWADEEFKFITDKLKKRFDLQHGGFREAPKFPMPAIWNFLLAAAQKQDNPDLEKHLNLTFTRLALGGIFDHLAGGWTRYSTDEEWKVPHFEKMLYDNAQLIGLYASTYNYLEQTNKFTSSQKLYAWAIEKTLDWLQDELQAENGLYFAALDADSEGEEGKYYTWLENDLQEILKEDYPHFSTLYHTNQAGNWEDEKNVLHLEKIESEADWPFLIKNWPILKKERENRIKPGLDNKLIASWNALLLSGLASVAHTFGYEDYGKSAKKLAEALETVFLQEFENKHFISHISTANTHGFLEDYACIIQAFTDFYQLSFEEKWLRKAKALADVVIDHFYDSHEGLFFYIDDRAEQLIARKKEIYDNVIPASNSILANALFDLGKLLSNEKYTDLAVSMFAKVKKIVLAEPGYMGNWAKLGLKLHLGVPEIAITGPNALEVGQQLFKKSQMPIYCCASETPSELPLLHGRFNSGQETLIYICRNQVCQLPVNTIAQALQLIYDY